MLLEHRYRMLFPPGIERERLQGSTRIQLQNEQSLSVKVLDLEAGQTRTVYKNVNIDLRMYKHLKMFVHAEGLQSEASLRDDEFEAVLRIGSDLIDNYYEITYPLKVTSFNATSAEEIWLNEMDIVLEHLGKLKLLRYQEGIAPNVLYPAYGAPSPIPGT